MERTHDEYDETTQGIEDTALWIARGDPVLPESDLMRILAFSDLHRDRSAADALLAASRDADVLVGAGDFATQGVGADDTLQILAQSNAPVILVHGNHDDPAEIAALSKTHANLHHLHGDTLAIGGVNFFGLGGEIPLRNDTPWNASETEERAAQYFLQCPAHSVVVTHTPPYGVADLQKTGEHEGSTAVREMAIRSQPTLLLCGHIHHSWGAKGQIGATAVHNLGPSANWFEV